ncbi:hypothetical protein ACQ4PT_011819 [Festuca glaucescens]
MAMAAGKVKEKGKEVETEGVEGMLRKLQIAEQRKYVTLGRPSASKKVNPNQAVGKVLSEKLAHAEGLQNTLGKIWCPREGTVCKEMRRNVFLFTFGQASGKRRALEEGPWLVGKDILVLEDFVDNKTLDEYEFCFFQIWVRVSNLPLGRMNRETVELMGKAMGECLEVDVDDVGFAIGDFLRVKVRLDVHEPLMRGIKVRLEEEEEEEEDENKGRRDAEENEEGEGQEGEEDGRTGPSKWCRFSYEFLPNFCFTCGVIGHNDKECKFCLKKGEKQMYTRDLKADMSAPQRRLGGEEERGQWSSGRGGFSARSNSSGGRGNWSRSDSESWRKKDENYERAGQKKPVEEKEVTSPLKALQPKEKSSVQKALAFCETDMVVDGTGMGVEIMKFPVIGAVEVEVRQVEQLSIKGGEEEARVGVQVQVPEKCRGAGSEGDKGEVKALRGKLSRSGEKPKQFRRIDRNQGSDNQKGGAAKVLGNKRELAMMDVDGLVEEEKAKRIRSLEINVESEVEAHLDAGLQIQPCKDQ